MQVGGELYITVPMAPGATVPSVGALLESVAKRAAKKLGADLQSYSDHASLGCPRSVHHKAKQFVKRVAFPDLEALSKQQLTTLISASRHNVIIGHYQH